MAYFDFLIDKGLEADTGKEYMYLFHIAWNRGLPFLKQEVKIQYGTIVYVASDKNDAGHARGYWFVTKETGELFHCNYAWAFAEHTPENVRAVLAYRECAKRVKLMESQRDELWKNVVTLGILK